jgi:chemotaxis family two-component system response regulator Rcp1
MGVTIVDLAFAVFVVRKFQHSTNVFPVKNSHPCASSCAENIVVKRENETDEPAATILLGEDNPADVYLIRQALEENGVKYTLNVASHGGEMMAAVSKSSKAPDLVVLDLNLPRHDGLEILKLIRDNGDFSHVPVVILTSSDSPKDRTAASILGAACYIRKPSNLEEFMAIGVTLQTLLNSRHRAAAN